MIKKICTALSISILVTMTLVSVLLAIPPILGFRTYAVLSGSMEPVLPVGSMAYVESVLPKEVSPGDIITYTTAGNSAKLVTHRVIGINTKGRTFITKGDANEVEDGPVSFDRLVGRMRFNIPYLGYLTVFLKSKKGIIIILCTTILLILLTILPDVLSKPDHHRQKA